MSSYLERKFQNSSYRQNNRLVLESSLRGTMQLLYLSYLKNESEYLFSIASNRNSISKLIMKYYIIVALTGT